jgi:hypothetical protein
MRRLVVQARMMQQVHLLAGAATKKAAEAAFSCHAAVP